jgi:hypothetical protein
VVGDIFNRVPLFSVLFSGLVPCELLSFVLRAVSRGSPLDCNTEGPFKHALGFEKIPGLNKKLIHWRSRRCPGSWTSSFRGVGFNSRVYPNDSYLVDPASSHMLVSKIKPCMSKYKQIYTVKLRMAH